MNSQPCMNVIWGCYTFLISFLISIGRIERFIFPIRIVMPPRVLFGGPFSAAFHPLQFGQNLWSDIDNGQGLSEGSSDDSDKVSYGAKNRKRYEFMIR